MMHDRKTVVASQTAFTAVLLVSFASVSIAMILMVAGIGMFACFSGLVASLFLGDGRQDTAEFENLDARFDAIRRQLDRIAGPGGPPSP
jgi:hypothetical protein